MSKRIFINYRRVDTQTEAKLLYDFLNKFEVEKIFYDINTIAPGSKFPPEIKDAIEACDLMLVLIGNRWEYQFGTRNGIDYAVEEIDTALVLEKKIIPMPFNRK